MRRHPTHSPFRVLARRGSRRLAPRNPGRAGYTILAAKRGEVAIELTRQHAPDLILIDVQLPDIAGAEAAGLGLTTRPAVFRSLQSMPLQCPGMKQGHSRADVTHIWRSPSMFRGSCKWSSATPGKAVEDRRVNSSFSQVLLHS